MGRVINPETAGKERTRLTKAIALAIREMQLKQQVDAETRDLAAFVALSLFAIHDSIDVSVAAWEKRGYWVKADRFRIEWSWSEKHARAMQSALLDEDWTNIALINVQIMQNLKQVQIPKRNNLGNPWQGAWEHLQKKNKP